MGVPYFVGDIGGGAGGMGESLSMLEDSCGEPHLVRSISWKPISPAPMRTQVAQA